MDTKKESSENNFNAISHKTDVSRSVIGLFIHYDNGDMINIQDLPKPEYEKFLEQMNALRMAYIALVSRS